MMAVEPRVTALPLDADAEAVLLAATVAAAEPWGTLADVDAQIAALEAGWLPVDHVLGRSGARNGWV